MHYLFKFMVQSYTLYSRYSPFSLLLFLLLSLLFLLLSLLFLLLSLLSLLLFLLLSLLLFLLPLLFPLLPPPPLPSPSSLKNLYLPFFSSFSTDNKNKTTLNSDLTL